MCSFKWLQLDSNPEPLSFVNEHSTIWPFSWCLSESNEDLWSEWKIAKSLGYWHLENTWFNTEMYKIASSLGKLLICKKIVNKRHCWWVLGYFEFVIVKKLYFFLVISSLNWRFYLAIILLKIVLHPYWFCWLSAKFIKSFLTNTFFSRQGAG